MTSRRQKSDLIDEAFMASEELSLVEQTGTDDLVRALTMEHRHHALPERDKEELSEISGLLSSILMDVRSLRPREASITAGGVRGPTPGRRRVLER